MVKLIQCGCGWAGELSEWAAVHKCSRPVPPRIGIVIGARSVTELTPLEVQAASMARARASLRVI